MKLLHITSKTTLQKFRDEGRIRFSQPDRKIILYDRDSIYEFLDKHTSKKLGTNGKKLSRYFRKRRQRHDRKVKPRIAKLWRRGLSVRAIADELNRRGIATPSGKGNWHFSTVHGIIKRNKI